VKTIRSVFTLPILAFAQANMRGVAEQQQDQDHHDNYTYKEHQEWKAGSRVLQEDWNRREKIDCRQNHLRRPPAMNGIRLIEITCWRTRMERSFQSATLSTITGAAATFDTTRYPRSLRQGRPVGT